MRIDAHQHFWKYDPFEYAWIADGMAALKRDFLPPHLKPLLDAAGFSGCVAVQARQSPDETRWLLELAREFDYLRGVVGWVDLCAADVEAQLEALASDAKLVGIRHIVQDEPDHRFLLRPDFCRGIAALPRFHLAYDVLIYPRQLPAAIEFAARFPQQRLVLDHIAKPRIADGVLQPWAAQMRELAQCGNVYCKLSGMGTEAKWGHARAADFRPYLDVVLEAFGVERLMIGSDWPVCTLAADYSETMRVVTSYIAQFTATQREAILGGNCARFYGLEQHGAAGDGRWARIAGA